MYVCMYKGSRPRRLLPVGCRHEGGGAGGPERDVEYISPCPTVYASMQSTVYLHALVYLSTAVCLYAGRVTSFSERGTVTRLDVQ